MHSRFIHENGIVFFCCTNYDQTQMQSEDREKERKNEIWIAKLRWMHLKKQEFDEPYEM